MNGTIADTDLRSDPAGDTTRGTDTDTDVHAPSVCLGALLALQQACGTEFTTLAQPYAIEFSSLQ